MDFTMILAGNLEITPQVVAETAEDYNCRAAAAYASRALEVADAIYSVAPVVPGVLGVPGVPGVPGGLLLPDGTGQHHQGPGAAAELPMPRVQGFRPINEGHRDLAPPVEAKPPQPQDPSPRKKQQAEKVLCVCTFCTAGNAEGKWLSKKTKHEHEHGDRIDKNGEQVADEDRCDRCAKSNTRCVKSKDSAVCGHCTRIKEKCSFTGCSKRKRDQAKRRNQAERAARLAQQNKTSLPDGGHDAAQQSSSKQGEQGAEKPCEDGREGDGSGRPSSGSSRSRSRTADNASGSPPPPKRRRKKFVS